MYCDDRLPSNQIVHMILLLLRNLNRLLLNKSRLVNDEGVNLDNIGVIVGYNVTILEIGTPALGTSNIVVGQEEISAWGITRVTINVL